MMKITVSGKEYTIKFGYGILGETDLLEKVASVGSVNGVDAFKVMISTLAELLLAGLQKYHYDEFAYITDVEKKVVLGKVYDILDLYDEESTEEHPQDCFELFEKLNAELEKNGFLSKMTQILESQAKPKKK